jgi:hypothetical protein
MFGNCQNIQNIGLVPMSIYLLFKLIKSFKISIVEIKSNDESFKDLLNSYKKCNLTLLNSHSSYFINKFFKVN